MICPYCKGPAPLTDSKEIYGKSYGMVYLCKPCDAYVGTHRAGSLKGQPLGTLANEPLRKARNECHRHFDKLWKNCRMSRTGAYFWLKYNMRLPAKDAHIAMFDLAQCEELLRLLAKEGL